MKDEIWKPVEDFKIYEISNFGRVKSLEREIIQLQTENKAREPEKKQAIFEIVVENINKDEVIEFNNKGRYEGGLHPNDKVRVIRKNKKSVTVKVFHRSWDRNQRTATTTGAWVHSEDDNCRVKRIPAKVFGEWVFKNPQFKVMIERNEKLKELLG